MSVRIGVLTVSDRVSQGVMQDEGGPAIERALRENQWTVKHRQVVADEREAISTILRRWADVDRLDIVFTTGGTGLGPRDVTPEATADIATRDLPGIAEAIRATGIHTTPHAMLSRGRAVVRGSTIIINLPGSPSGAIEGVGVVVPVLTHAVAILAGGSH